jgi:hypothetical protein
MKPDPDLQIIEFLWNRLNYRQQTKRRMSAAYYLIEPYILQAFTVVSSLVTQGLPIADRRTTRKLHFINDRRKPTSWGSVPLITFIFIIITIITATWKLAHNIHPTYAAPLMFINIVTLSAIFIVKPYRFSSHKYSACSSRIFGGGQGGG